MRRTPLVGLLLGAALTLLAAPAPACEPLPPGVYGSIPETGESLPANARLLLLGSEISTGAMSATVDGAPWSVVVAEPVAGFGAVALRFEPAPPSGAELELTGDFCPPEYGCEPVALRFVIGAPDESAPTVPAGLGFDVYDYADFFSSGGDCQVDSALAYFLHADTKAETSDQSELFVRWRGFLAGTDGPPIFDQAVLPREEGTEEVARFVEATLAGAAPATALCFTATAEDAAGNLSASSAPVCSPCYFRADPAGTASPDWPPDEPAWSFEDVYAEGPCAGMVPDETVEVGGCDCELARARGSSHASFALFAAALALASRRRARP